MKNTGEYKHINYKGSSRLPQLSNDECSMKAYVVQSQNYNNGLPLRHDDSAKN